ncbi:hypothetical protein [Klebsiella oxytoca]|nr:hypothetical protein [Klebsiella oxytoca]MEB2919586.1 hypothetical protein [Klebsiella oxytoca]HEG4373751.1 hypothetical protein [Klebsiella oxytoca]
MNTFLYVLLAWIVVLFIANKLLARRKPKTVKILVQRNGKAAEVDAVVVQGSKSADDGDDLDDDQDDGLFDLNPYTREN